MSVWHISQTGTKSSLSPSTPDDWSDNNCFPLEGGTYDFQNCFNAASDGDELIFNYGTHYQEDRVNIGNGPGEALNLIFKKRDGLAGLSPDTIISSNYTSNSMFAHNSDSYAHVIEYRDVTFTKSITFTAATGAVTSHSGVTGDTTFTRCKFSGISVNSAASSTNGMITQTTTMASGTRNITYNECEFVDLTLRALERPGIVASVTDNLVFANDCTMTNCSLESTSGEVLSMFYDYGSPIVCDGFSVSDLSIIGDGVNAVSGGLLFQPVAGSKITASNVHVDGVNISGAEGGCSAPLMHGRVDVELRTSSIKNATNSSFGNSIGCLFLVGGTGVGLVEDCESSNNTGFYGAGCYNTFSGTVIAKRVKAWGNNGGVAGLGFDSEDINGVDFYSGGSGDATWDFCESDGAIVQPTSKSSSVFGINNTAGGRTVRDKVITIRHGTFANPETSDVGLAVFSNVSSTGNSLTVNVTNTIIDNPDGVDIACNDSAGNVCDINLTNSKYNNLEVTDLVGTATETSTKSGESGFISNTDFGLQSDSVCVGSGVLIPEIAFQRSLQEPLPRFDIDIGSRQSTYSPFHPENL